MKTKKFFLYAFIGVAAVLLFQAGNAFAGFINGSFETGDYTGWTLSEDGGIPSLGTWGIAQNGQTISPGESTHDYYDGIDVIQNSPGLPHQYTATDGNFLAYQLQNGAEFHRMYQDVVVTGRLAWDMEYENHNTTFDNTRQYLAVTLRDPGTDAIIDTLFKTQDGDPLSIPMSNFSYDVSAYSGQLVRVSVDMQVKDFYFDAAFDNFRTFSAVPEPSTLMLLGAGLIAFAGIARKKQEA